MNLRQELIQRYETTGRVGLEKPKSRAEAMKLIETVIWMYNEQTKETINESIKINIHSLSERIKKFLDSIE